MDKKLVKNVDHISYYLHIDTWGLTFSVFSREMTLMKSLSVWSLSLLVSACHLTSGSEATQQMEQLTGSVSFLSDVTEPLVTLVCQSAFFTS